MPDGAPILVKEVQTPQRYDNGLGVLVVASAAVFIALLGSSMVLRARSTPCSLAQRPVVAPSVAPVVPATPPLQAGAASPAPCGEPVFHDASDGTLRIVYTVCSPAAALEAVLEPDQAAATRLPPDLLLR